MNDTFGEIHIVLNERLRQLRRRYGAARRSVSDAHILELQRIVDEHPEYYLDEFVRSLARICGVFYHPSTISRIILHRLGYSLQVLQEVAAQHDENLRRAYQ